MLIIKPTPIKKPSFEPITASQEIKKQIKDFIWETFKIIIISLVIIIPVRYFLIQPFYVKGASMEPNFYDHEYLIIDEISYRLDEPARGDVIVFKYPNDPNQYFIKRIIGLPGETINLKDNKIFIINDEYPDGFELDETLYLPNTYTTGNKETVLGPFEYYVLGDNRSSSMDSRIFGPIDRNSIIGKTWIRGWPLNRVKLFNDSIYKN